MKMAATFSSRTSVDFQQTTWRYVPEDLTLPNYLCENLSSYDNGIFVEKAGSNET
jgi:hypothetical protein